MTAHALTLFDQLPTPTALPEPDELDRCFWHEGHHTTRPAGTHCLVLAVDLMHPRWWRNGLRDDGALRGCDGGRVRLYTVGAGVCDACLADCEEDPDDWDRFGRVTHFAPLHAVVPAARTEVTP